MPGFEAKFKHPLLKRHECPICLFAMRHPVQTECGHLFCRDCLEPVLKRRHPICPLDKEEITQEGTFPDNACRREILKLQVFCNFQNCPWIAALKDLEVCTKYARFRPKINIKLQKNLLRDNYWDHDHTLSKGLTVISGSFFIAMPLSKLGTILNYLLYSAAVKTGIIIFLTYCFLIVISCLLIFWLIC